MPRTRAVLLDAGDTLITERTSRGEVYAAVLREAGVKREPAAMSAALQHSHARLPLEIEGQYRYSPGWFEHFIRDVLEQVDVPWTPALETGLFAAFARPHTFRLFADVTPCLEALRARGLRLAVVSNWAPHLPEVLAGLGIATDFEQIVVSACERVEKPAPEIYELCLRRLALGAGDVAFVGDSRPHDVEGPRAAGIEHTCLLDRTDREEQSVPRIAGLDELPRWLGSLVP